MSPQLWDIRNGRCELTLAGHANSVMSVQFDDSYKVRFVGFDSHAAYCFETEQIVSGSYDKTIKVWDMRMDKLLNTFEARSALCSGYLLAHHVLLLDLRRVTRPQCSA